MLKENILFLQRYPRNIIKQKKKKRQNKAKFGLTFMANWDCFVLSNDVDKRLTH